MTPSNTPKVLIIDDDSFIAEIIQASLEMNGNYLYRLCHSGSKALECLNDFPPDIVILDLLLEDMDGIDLLKEMSRLETMKSVPIVVLTGSDEPGIKRKALEAGASSYVQKPFVPHKLVNLIQELLVSS